MGDIHVNQVVKKYGDFTALRGIDLKVEDGEFMCLLGPSGCGKTTLMRSIAGLIPIEGGQITVDGKLFSEPGFSLPPEQRNLGMVFQSYALWPHMTVFGNIAYTLKTKGWDKDKIPGRVAEVLELVGLPGLEKRYAAQLSGGQMQRVALARSVAPAPSVLLFDEPLSNLDSKLREKMRFELRQIQQKVGITAIYVTHDQAEAMVVADRIALLNEGEVVQLGSGKDLYERPATSFAADFMGMTNFIHGAVTAQDGADATFDVGGAALQGKMPSAVRGAKKVNIAIRPEHIKLARTEAHAASRAGQVERATIENIVYLGHLSDVYVRYGDVVLRSQAVPDELEGLVRGDDIWIAITPERVRAVEALDRPADEHATEPGLVSSRTEN